MVATWDALSEGTKAETGNGDTNKGAVGGVAPDNQNLRRGGRPDEGAPPRLARDEAVFFEYGQHATQRERGDAVLRGQLQVRRQPGIRRDLAADDLLTQGGVHPLGAWSEGKGFFH